VLFTGPSGSGKSSLLRAAGAQLNAIDVHALDLPDLALIDALSGTIEQRLDHLAACGLSEARLLLRSPAELSDGQRYRFQLAYALDQASGVASAPRVSPSLGALTQPRSPFLLADEFAAMLDRTLAKVLAFNLRKLVTRTGIGALLATTHDDLIEDLNPDLYVRCLGDGHVAIERRDGKKKEFHSSTSFGCRKAPDPTGRISLGGIIAAIPSPSSNESSCSGTAAVQSEFASSAARRQA